MPAVTVTVIHTSYGSSHTVSPGDRLTADQLISIGATLEKGKRQIIIFFEPECPHCVGLLADMSKMHTDFRLDTHAMTALSIGDSTSTAQFVAHYSLPFPVIYDNLQLHQQLGIRTVPAVLLTDDSGMIQHNWLGRRSKKFIENVMSEFLTSSRIPIHALNDNVTFAFQRDFNLLGHFQNDSSLSVSIQRLVDKSSSLTEILTTKTVDGENVVHQYIVYGNICDHEGNVGTAYLLVSVLYDGQTDSIIDRHVFHDISLSSVHDYLEAHQQSFHAHSH